MTVSKKRMFLLQETECWVYGERFSYEEKAPGKRGESLSSVGSSESMTNDANGKDLTTDQMAV